MTPRTAATIHAEILSALGSGMSPPLDLRAGGTLSSAFAVSDLAQAAIGAAGSALARYIALSRGVAPPAVSVDRDLASAWFQSSVRTVGWTPPAVWDAVAGDYAGADGWIRLHTNAPHHRAAALGVLGVEADREAVTAAVAGWSVTELEDAVVAAGGAAAAMRSAADWSAHPVGAAVATEPLLWVDPGIIGPPPRRSQSADAPLAGLRVLDLTRVIAGPVATRTLAGWGADVLRLDPPGWDEGPLMLDVLAGKRTAYLDLRSAEQMATFRTLLSQADVLVHGLRADALARLGLGWRERQAIRPGLVDVSLNAYGWWGPWVDRRGFDSLVQMSSGIADTGRRWASAERPTPLPVQALDHATGYIMAAAALAGLHARLLTGAGSRWRASLARTARLLSRYPAPGGETADISVPEPLPALEPTSWGDVRRLPAPVVVDGAPLRWSLPAPRPGSDRAAWA